MTVLAPARASSLLSWAVMRGACCSAWDSCLPSCSDGGTTLGSLAARIAVVGAGVLTILIMGVSLVLPLRSGSAAIIIVVVTVILVLSACLGRHDGSRGGAAVAPRHASAVDPRGWPVVGVLYLAVAALGPVTNYDSGLYHLGAIAYAGDYPRDPRPGQPLLPLGYANAEFPLAAILGNGPWDGVGFRLLNGLLFAAMALDLSSGRGGAADACRFFVLAVGTAAAFVPMVALSDYWVTSPTSDSAVLALTLVVAAYLVDAVDGPGRGRRTLAWHRPSAMLTVMLRPTMAVFAVGRSSWSSWSCWRSREHGETRPVMAGMVPVGAVLACWQGSSRLRVTTCSAAGCSSRCPCTRSMCPGWPRIPIEFRVRDAGRGSRSGGTVGCGEGWGWVRRWVGRLRRQWETYEFAGLAMVALMLIVLAARSRVALRRAALLLVMVPSSSPSPSGGWRRPRPSASSGGRCSHWPRFRRAGRCGGWRSPARRLTVAGARWSGSLS